MAWIESHQALGHHPKTLRLAAALRCGVPAAIGYVHLLWYWALDYAQDGAIDGGMRDQVAQACLWRGKPESFWMGLLQAGFIEPTERGVCIHDWMEYAGRLVEKRAANAARSKRARDAHRAGLPTVPTVPTNHTEPDHTNPTPPTPPSDQPNGGDWCCQMARITDGQTHMASCPMLKVAT